MAETPASHGLWIPWERAGRSAESALGRTGRTDMGLLDAHAPGPRCHWCRPRTGGPGTELRQAEHRERESRPPRRSSGFETKQRVFRR